MAVGSSDERKIPRSLRELELRAKRKLAVLRHVEEVSGSVAATYRYYGISRQCYYVWRRRCDEEGVEGLNDRSSVPHRQSTKTDLEVNREDPLAPTAVPLRTTKNLDVPARYHDVTISPSGVWRILHKLGLNRAPASQRYKHTQTRWKRYEKQRPGHQLQVDVKFIEPLSPTGKKSVTTSTP